MGLTIETYDYNGIATLNNVYATVRNIRTSKIDRPYPEADTDQFAVTFNIGLWIDNAKTKYIEMWALHRDISFTSATVVTDVWTPAYSKAKEVLEAAGYTVTDNN